MPRRRRYRLGQREQCTRNVPSGLSIRIASCARSVGVKLKDNHPFVRGVGPGTVAVRTPRRQISKPARRDITKALSGKLPAPSLQTGDGRLGITLAPAHADRHRRRRHQDRRHRARGRWPGVARHRERTPTVYDEVLRAVAGVVARLEAGVPDARQRDRRRRNAGRPAPEPRRDAERQPRLPGRTAAGSRSGGTLGQPHPPRQRREVLRLVRGDRRRGGAARGSGSLRAPTSCSAPRWEPASAAASSSTGAC